MDNKKVERKLLIYIVKKWVFIFLAYVLVVLVLAALLSIPFLLSAG